MTVSFVGSTGKALSGPTGTVDMPAGVQDGDRLLFFLQGFQSSDPITGWSFVDSVGSHFLVYQRTANNEPASYVLSLAGSGRYAVGIVAYRGAASGLVKGKATGSGFEIVAPPVTVTEPATVLSFFGAAQSPAVWSMPPGTTQRAIADDGSGTMAARVSDAPQASAGATPTRTVGLSTSTTWNAHTIALYNANVAPNAPTNLSPNGATIDKDVTQRFSWTPSDPDPGDTQSKYDLRYRAVGTGTWTTVTATTSNTFPAGTFAAEDYEWQVRTYDALGAVGPWSSSAFFTAAPVPPGPTITDPVNGQTIPSADYTATISYPDMESWEWRVLGDDGGNPDETDVIIPATTRPSTTRTFHMQGLPNGVTVHPQVRVLEGGLWSQWVSSTNPVSFTPPAVPSVAASVDNQAGAIDVQATHPQPAGGQPAVVSVDWWRRRLLVDADGLFTGYDPDRGGEDGIPLARGASQPPSAMFVDWQVGDRSVYAYRARARGNNETSSWSEWTEAATETLGYYGGGYDV